ncbi:MAG: TlpA family protein disulfide reductase [Saprospiraceae bacterium]|nr:TlpA family protein disulfide reductase [Saprospiraceae bacterium]
MVTYLFSSVIFLFIIGCVVPGQKFEKIPPGIWRAVLLLDRTPVQKYGDDRDIVKKFDLESELPFNFEVIYDSDSIFHLVIHNADERIRIDDITFGRDKATAKDTIIINFPVYDTQIRAIYEDGVMEGDWIVNYKDNYKIPFKAVHGMADRFTALKSKHIDVEGKWDCTFEIATDDEYKAVGVFDQKGDILHGTFMTETGDYRYLEGKVVGNKIYMSVFDGAHAFLFLGKMMENGKLSGTFRSGSQYTTNWEGIRDSKASLVNSYDLTKSVSSEPLNFSFENESGKTVSINDEKYNNKIKIVQIMGTWCPNCMDETIFLKDYFSKNKNDDIAIFSVGFERYKDANKSKQSLKKYKERMHIDHEVLYGGYYDKKVASDKIPQIDKIMSYPTMIITDRNNKIVKIHTGFSGPATPDYDQFKSEFTSIIEKIRNN